MEFREILARRRMHRAFLPDPVPDEAIERIARTVRRAPSGGYSQGQSVVVVTDETLRREIAHGFEEEYYTGRGGAPFISTASVHVVVCANERLYHDRYREPDKLADSGGVEIEWPVPYWFVDAGAAMMLILLAAIDEGLAAAFIGHPKQESFLRSLLDLPGDVVPIGVALVGRPWLVLRGRERQAVLWGGPVLELHRRNVLRVGPDILADPPDLERMLANLRAEHQRTAAGDAILNQRLVSGIGNVWKAEALWHARVSPWRPLADVSDAELVTVLEEANRLMRVSVETGREVRRIYRR